MKSLFYTKTPLFYYIKVGRVYGKIKSELNLTDFTKPHFATEWRSVMKKKLFRMLWVVLVIVLFSCKGNGDEGPGGAGNGDSNIIYGDNTQITVVMNDLDDLDVKEAMEDFCNALAPKLPSYPSVISSSEKKRGNEIVFGKTDRDVSLEAYSRLDKIRYDETNEGAPRLLIYTDGSSIAVAYDECEGNATFFLAVEYFLENLLTDNFSSDAGTLYKEIVDLDAYFSAKDDALVEEMWGELAGAVGGELGEEIVVSFKKLYGLYTDDMISWFANLYDPAVGGWYYSNSGRNTDGYLPDAESTQQALRFIDDSGMIDTIAPNGYEDALPDEMKTAIGSFIYNLQDQNGYFYHPQWSKTAVDNKTSRRSRDLGWCTNILGNLGITPKYTTPSGVAGDDLAAASVRNLTLTLGASPAVAVSRVVDAAESTVAVDPKLKDKDSFIKYLDSLNIQTESYSAGNTLTAFYSEIANRDKALQEQNVGYSLVEIMINYLNEKQFDNGTWHAEINYYAINGFMKMSGVYSKSGSPLPNSHKALESCIAAITSDEEPDAITDIYNTWFATKRAFSIIENNEGDSGKAYVKEKRRELLESASYAIELTAKRVANFAKNDGSFSYSPEGAPKTSQGMPVAIGVNEGDINGTLLCSSDLLTYVYGALGLSEYRVPTHTYSDWREYLRILGELQPVIKDTESSVYEPITFDDLPMGEINIDEMTVNDRSYSQGGGASVVEDPRGTGGNVLSVRSVAGTSDSVEIISPNLSHAFSCFAFEGDFCLNSTNTDFPIRITMGESYIISVKVIDGKVRFVESSSETLSRSKDVELPMSAELGEWFRLKIEYYKGDHDTVRIKVYFDGDLTDGVSERLVAVSDNYLDQNGDKFINGTGDPATQYNSTSFWFMKSYDVDFLMDNVCAYKLDQRYKKYTDKNDPLKLNVDAPVAEDGDGTAVPGYTDTYYNRESVPGTRYDYSEKLGKDSIYNKVYDALTEAETVSVPIPTDIYGGRLNVTVLSNWLGFAIRNLGETEGYDGAKYVFDTTFVWNGGRQSAGAGAAAYIGFIGDHRSVDNHYMMSSITLSFSDTDSNILNFGGAELEKGKAYNIRIEYAVGGELRLFVDNVEYKSTASKGKSSDESSYEAFGFYLRKSFIDAFEFSFDDTFLGIISIGSNDDITPEEIDPYAPPKDEGLPEGLETFYGNSEYAGTRYDFTSSEDYTEDRIYDKTAADGVIESDIARVSDGKLYVDNGGLNWRGLAFNNEGVTAGGDGYTYIFEADFRWTSGHQATAQLASGAAFIGFLGEHTSVDNHYMSSWGYLKFIEGETDLILLGNAELKRGTTYNIRFEYTVGVGVSMYVNGVLSDFGKITVGKNSDSSCYQGFGIYVRKSFSPDLEFTVDNVYMGVIAP